MCQYRNSPRTSWWGRIHITKWTPTIWAVMKVVNVISSASRHDMIAGHTCSMREASFRLTDVGIFADLEDFACFSDATIGCFLCSIIWNSEWWIKTEGKRMWPRWVCSNIDVGQHNRHYPSGTILSLPNYPLGLQYDQLQRLPHSYKAGRAKIGGRRRHWIRRGRSTP